MVRERVADRLAHGHAARGSLPFELRFAHARWPYTAAAIRSAIIIVVGLSATDGTTGMIDASTTRRASMPCTAPRESTTARRAAGTAHRDR